MVLLVNVSNLRFGGGKTVAFNIIESLKSFGHNLVVVAPYNCDYEKFRDERTTVIIVKKKYNLPWFKPLLGLYLLPKLEKNHKPDFVLSLGNIAFKSQAKQLLLIHIPYLVYPNSPVWKFLSIGRMLIMKSMLALITRNLKYANYIFVQTQTMKIRLNRYFKTPLSDIHILPNSISFTSVQKITEIDLTNLETIKLLFLSKYYPHKNFEILIDLGKKIRDQDLPISISVTLDKSDSKESLQFLDRLQKENLSNIIVNLGHIEMNDVGKTYEQHNGLFLPSYLESFSGTYIEAMYFGRPIFTSDLDFAHEVCKDVAYYFDPEDATNILSVITQAFSNKQEMQSKIRKGYDLSLEFDSWIEISHNLNQFINSQTDKLEV